MLHQGLPSGLLLVDLSPLFCVHPQMVMDNCANTPFVPGADISFVAPQAVDNLDDILIYQEHHYYNHPDDPSPPAPFLKYDPPICSCSVPDMLYNWTLPTAVLPNVTFVRAHAVPATLPSLNTGNFMECTTVLVSNPSQFVENCAPDLPELKTLPTGLQHFASP